MAEVFIDQSPGNEDEAKRVVSMFDRAFSKREPFAELWEDVYELTIPERWQRIREEDPRAIYDSLYDSTAVQAAARLSNLLVTGLVPPWVKWFSLVPGPLLPEDQRQALRVQLDLVNKILFIVLNSSNLSQEIQPAFLDLMIGQGAILVEPARANQGVQFTCVPIDDLAFAEDAEGIVSHIYRRHMVPAWEILRNGKWMDRIGEDSELGRNLRADTTKTHEVKVAVLPTDNNRFSLHTIIQQGAGGQPGPMYLEDPRVLRRNPYLVFRWSKIAGSPYGRGPALESFGDNRALNKVKELTLLNLALAVNPAVTAVDDGIVNPYNLTIAPGAVIPVLSNDRANPPLSAFNDGRSFDAAFFGMKDVRDSLQIAFLADRFSPITGTKMTATEIIERSRVIAQDLGATYSRLQNELLFPLVRNVVGILSAQNILPDIPIDGNVVDVVFLSQLAQAQRLQEVDSLLQFSTVAQQLGQTDPRAGLVLDSVEVLRRMSELMSIDSAVLRDDAEIDATIAQFQAQAQAMTQPGETNEAQPPVQ